MFADEIEQLIEDDRALHLLRAREIREANRLAGSRGWRSGPLPRPEKRTPTRCEIRAAIEDYRTAWRRRHRPISSPSKAQPANYTTANRGIVFSGGVK